MIKKLRAKFVLIIMCLITVILAAVLVAVCLFFVGSARHQSNQTLEMAMSRPRNQQPPSFQLGAPPQEGFIRSPVFALALHTDGSATLAFTDRVAVTDDDLAAIAAILAGRPEGYGELPDYNLRYLLRANRDGSGHTATFIDITEENRMVGTIILTCLLVGVLALALFFAASMFLARWALKPAEEAWAQQRRFVADASHELKTPLTVILANTEILKAHRESTVAQQMTWIENTGEEARRMRGLVDNLLFLARGDDQAEAPATETVALSEALAGAALLFESVAFEEGIALQANVKPGILVEGNTGQLGQLADILLDNAVKYAKANSTVTLSLEKHHGNAKISVHNWGTPIADEEKARLFDRFYRADFSRAETGYGLGLSIAHTIVETHKGKITVESSPEKGTAFTVSLPLRR